MEFWTLDLNVKKVIEVTQGKVPLLHFKERICSSCDTSPQKKKIHRHNGFFQLQWNVIVPHQSLGFLVHFVFTVTVGFKETEPKSRGGCCCVLVLFLPFPKHKTFISPSGCLRNQKNTETSPSSHWVCTSDITKGKIFSGKPQTTGGESSQDTHRLSGLPF